MMKISAVVHTYNEEHNIKDCLATLTFADEIVVVDNESSDQTVELAKACGARIATYAGHHGYPEPARVFGLTQLNHDWVFILDADERVTPELRAELLAVKDAAQAQDGYWVPIKNFHFGRWLQHGGLYPDYHMRFFKREKGGYPEVGLHRGIEVSGETGYLQENILHFSYRDIYHYFEKFNTYTTVEAERILTLKRRPTGYSLLMKPLHRFTKSYLFKGGFKDGLEGFLFHLFSAAYIFTSEVKAWDTYRRQNEHLPVFSTMFKRKA
ncbi:glycosyltransferase family 2 protein [bacterium]|nr:glycosyltransferase family 2 protein [bacterium]